MQIKLSNILEFSDFFSKVKTAKLSFKTSYRLTTLATEIQKNVEFFQTQLNALVQEYGKKDENGYPTPTPDGGGVLLAEETMEEAYKRFNELHNLEVDLPDITFTIEEFETLELSPMEISAILPFIKE